MNQATYHIPTDQLRAQFADRLSSEDYATITAAGFRWHRHKTAFVATWTPIREDTLYQLGIETIELDDDPDDIAGRIDRYAELASNATARSTAAHDRARAITAMIPFGQPILIGHHSERRHRAALAREDRAMGTFVTEYHKAEYWRQRAEGAERRARQHDDMGVRNRRLKKLEADRRSIARRLAALGEPNAWRTAEEIADSRQWDERWIAHYDMRIAYEQSQIEE